MEKAAEFLDGFFDQILESKICWEIFSESFFDSLIEALRQSFDSSWEISVSGRLMHLLQIFTNDEKKIHQFFLPQKEKILDLIVRCLKFLINFELLDANFNHWIAFMSCLRIFLCIGKFEKEKNLQNLQTEKNFEGKNSEILRIRQILPLVDDLRDRFRSWKQRNLFEYECFLKP